jgi:phage gp29-like protein
MDFRYLERFGNPVRLGRYPRKNLSARTAILELIDDLAREQVALFPSDEGYDVEYLEASGGGHVSFQNILDYLDRQISKAYLGSTLLMDVGDTGSYSLGRVHERTTFGRVAEYDHHCVASTLNQFLLPWIFELNHWPSQYIPTFEFTMKESQDINQLIEALRIAQAMGFKISSEMITEQTGFRAMRPGEHELVLMDANGQMSISSGGNQLMEQAAAMASSEAFTLRRRIEALEAQTLQFSLDAAHAKRAA